MDRESNWIEEIDQLHYENYNPKVCLHKHSNSAGLTVLDGIVHARNLSNQIDGIPFIYHLRKFNLWFNENLLHIFRIELNYIEIFMN